MDRETLVFPLKEDHHADFTGLAWTLGGQTPFPPETPVKTRFSARFYYFVGSGPSRPDSRTQLEAPAGFPSHTS